MMGDTQEEQQVVGRCDPQVNNLQESVGLLLSQKHKTTPEWTRQTETTGNILKAF